MEETLHHFGPRVPKDPNYARALGCVLRDTIRIPRRFFLTHALGGDLGAFAFILLGSLTVW